MVNSAEMDIKSPRDFSLGDSIHNKLFYFFDFLRSKLAIVVNVSSVRSSISDSIFLIVLAIRSPRQIAKRIIQPTVCSMKSNRFVGRSIANECQKYEVMNWSDFNLSFEDYSHHEVTSIGEYWGKFNRYFSKIFRPLEGSGGINIALFVSKVANGIWNGSHAKYGTARIGKSKCAYS